MMQSVRSAQVVLIWRTWMNTVDGLIHTAAETGARPDGKRRTFPNKITKSTKQASTLCLIWACVIAAMIKITPALMTSWAAGSAARCLHCRTDASHSDSLTVLHVWKTNLMHVGSWIRLYSDAGEGRNWGETGLNVSKNWNSSIKIGLGYGCVVFKRTYSAGAAFTEPFSREIKTFNGAKMKPPKLFPDISYIHPQFPQFDSLQVTRRSTCSLNLFHFPLLTGCTPAQWPVRWMTGQSWIALMLLWLQVV